MRTVRVKVNVSAWRRFVVNGFVDNNRPTDIVVMIEIVVLTSEYHPLYDCTHKTSATLDKPSLNDCHSL